MAYSKEQLKEILVSHGYPTDNERLLSSVINQIVDFSEEVNKCFTDWIENKKIVTFEVNGITADFLRNIRKQNEIAVLLSYEHLLRESKNGKSDFARLLKEKQR